MAGNRSKELIEANAGGGHASHDPRLRGCQRVAQVLKARTPIIGLLLASLFAAVYFSLSLRVRVERPVVIADSGASLVVPANLRVVGSTKPQHILVDFQVENVGHRPVSVLSCSSTCGCAAVTVPDSPIQIGATAICQVKIAHVAVGEKRFRITLDTDDVVKQKHVDITVVGKQEPPFFRNGPPDRIVLFRRRNETPVKQFHEIATNEQASSPLWLKGANVSLPSVAARLGMFEESPTADPKVVMRRYRLEIAQHESGQVGRTRGVVIFQTDDSVQPRAVQTDLMDEVAPVMHAAPAVVSLTEPTSVQLLGVAGAAAEVDVVTRGNDVEVRIETLPDKRIVAHLSRRDGSASNRSRKIEIEFIDRRSMETATLQVFLPRGISKRVNTSGAKG